MATDTLRRLREGKDALRVARRNAPLAEKLRMLVHAQHLYVQVAGSRRLLKSWQRPWNILNEVQDDVVIHGEQIEPRKLRVTASAQARWIYQDRQLF